MKCMLLLVLVLIAGSSAKSQQRMTSAKAYQNQLTKGLGCDLCVLVVGEIDQLLASSESVEAAIAAVGGICDLLGDLVAPTCHTFIETYLPQIIIYLVEHQLAPRAVCEALTLCEATPKFAKKH